MMDVESSEECLVSGALALALRMSQLVGVAPLQFRKARGGWHVRVSDGVHLYGQTTAVLLCIVTISVLLTDMLIEPDRSLRLDTMENQATSFTDFAMMSLVTLGGAFTGRQRMSSMVESLNQIQKITLELNRYRRGRNIEKKKWAILSVTFFAGLSGILLNYTLLLYENVDKHGKLFIGAAYIFYDILIIIQILLEIQFVLITLTIFTTLEHLNGCLEDLLSEITSEDIIKFKPNLTAEAVHQLSYLHGCGSEAVSQVDSSHGLVALLIISSSMLHLLLTLFNIIDSYFSVQVLKYFRYNPLTQAMWGTLHFCRLFAIVEPCHRTQEVIAKTKKLVSLMTLYSPPHGALAVELGLFFKHLSLNETAYCPMDMFTVNRELVVTMLSTITTYLVIVEQFK